MEKGWTKEQLASKADCARRSIYSAEKGNSISVTTLGLIANALKVSPKELLLSESPQPSPNLFRLQLVIEADMDKLNQSHAIESFVSLLRNLIPAQDDIVLKDIRQGSIILTLELEEEDARELVTIMPTFAEIARDSIRERIEQHVRRTPDFLELLNQAISRRPDGSYFASANVASINEAMLYAARQTDLLRLIDGVKELRISVGVQLPEGELLSDTVLDREEWELSPEILRMVGFATDESHPAKDELE